jgi:metal-sulfur cluster biosynthetic enzyme
MMVMIYDENVITIKYIMEMYACTKAMSIQFEIKQKGEGNYFIKDVQNSTDCMLESRMM